MKVVPGVLIGGKYQLEQPLARGGMGTVWIARHVKLGAAVAIKFLDAHLAAAPALVVRFEREARAAANLDTPHVVHVHDYGVEDGTPYLVMELLRGEDLSSRLQQRRRLSLPEAGTILTQMGRALRRAHEAGIVHRDLKPANVFLASIDDNEVVKILDFGIAKEKWSRVEDSTKTGELFGSPHYMSPEQARAQKDVDHRADLWAAGVIAYRMITGKLPFPGEVLGQVLSCVLVDPFPPIAQAAPDLPPTFEGFFMRALAKNKEQRFSSIGELVDAFGAASRSTAPGPSAILSISQSSSTTLDPIEPYVAPPPQPAPAPAPVLDPVPPNHAPEGLGIASAPAHAPPPSPVISSDHAPSPVSELPPPPLRLPLPFSPPLPGRVRIVPSPPPSVDGFLGRLPTVDDPPTPLRALRLVGPIGMLVLAILVAGTDMILARTEGSQVSVGPVTALWLAGPLAVVGTIWLIARFVGR